MCDFIRSLHWLNKKLSGLCFEVYIYTHSLHVILYTCQYVHCIYGFSIQKKWCFKPRHKSGFPPDQTMCTSNTAWVQKKILIDSNTSCHVHPIAHSTSFSIVGWQDYWPTIYTYVHVYIYSITINHIHICSNWLVIRHNRSKLKW